jgi:hypothetical protein
MNHWLYCHQAYQTPMWLRRLMKINNQEQRNQTRGLRLEHRTLMLQIPFVLAGAPQERNRLPPQLPQSA